VDVLQGKVCILTGASRGIGAALALRLAGLGLKVALVARSPEGLAEVTGRIQAAGGIAKPYPLDISDRPALAALVADVARDLGPPQVLVNNAGIETFQHYVDADPEEIAQAVAVNLTAPLVLIRHVLPHMLDQGEGQVVSMASTAGLVGTPYGAVYSATKAGLIAATASLRMEHHGQPVGFTAICPGFIQGAGMHEVHRREAGDGPATLGHTTVAAVVEAVVASLRDNPPERIVNSTPLRPMIGLGRAIPRLALWSTRQLSGTYMKKLADVRRG